MPGRSEKSGAGLRGPTGHAAGTGAAATGAGLPGLTGRGAGRLAGLAQPARALGDVSPKRRGRAVRVPTQARALRTREKILTAAVECFESTGFDETTTAMIAGRAGIGVGTLYGYFRDKREILIELLDRTVAVVGRMVVERLAAARVDQSDPRRVVRDLIDAVFHIHHTSPGLQRILWERYFKDETFRALYEEIRTRTRLAIEGFIDALDAQGMLRKIDREHAPFVLLNAVQWNATQALLSEDEATIDATARTTAEMVAAYLFR